MGRKNKQSEKKLIVEDSGAIIKSVKELKKSIDYSSTTINRLTVLLIIIALISLYFAYMQLPAKPKISIVPYSNIENSSTYSILTHSLVNNGKSTKDINIVFYCTPAVDAILLEYASSGITVETYPQQYPVKAVIKINSLELGDLVVIKTIHSRSTIFSCDFTLSSSDVQSQDFTETYYNTTGWLTNSRMTR